MKKTLIILGIIIALCIVWYLVSPLFINNKVSEELPVANNTAEAKVLVTGSFVGFDAVHQGSGTAKIIEIDGKKVLRFENDFNVSNGPDLFVGFGKNGQYVKGSEIAELKGNIGSQNYDLPEGFDYNEVWIWCKAFSVPFAKAELR